MLAGAAAVLLGSVLLIRLPASVPVRVLLNTCWLIFSIRELGRHAAGIHRIKGIRLAAGEAMVIDRQGRQAPVQIMSGSFVLPRLAWLRLKCADGLICCELLREESIACKQWCRLQILWRQGLS